MLESLRGLGYSTPAALADIIDNSVSAGAAEIHVDCEWAGTSSRISIRDDGRGMSDSELESAMRLGAKSPLDRRAPEDLGRFGMGLKTASFSHCRRLTVATMKDGVHACLRWDLDALAANASGEWLMFEGPAPGSEPFLDSLPDGQTGRTGTLVLWEKLDRIVTADYGVDDFNDMIDRVQDHLAMVFHRLLQGPTPSLRLFLNGREVVPWDPFMEGHPGKPWTSPIARIDTDHGPIEVQCHVLPHRDQLSTSEFETVAGPDGWTAQQGFYVYRNERLLASGGWLGLGQRRAWIREEAHQLARIRLDIPNTADAAWKIDIRKSTARPPVSIRPWLTRLAENTRERARKTFAFRGSPGVSSGGFPVEQAWRVEHAKSGIRYRIDDKHPAVSAVIDSSGTQLPLVRAMLRILEETIPVQRIWLDTAENKETPRTGFAGEPPEAIGLVLKTLFADLVGRRHMSTEAAKRTLLATEPFQNFPTLVAALRDAEQ